MSGDAFLKPEVVVFAGPNGSGKSTITGPEWIKGPYINADDIQREHGISVGAAANVADALRQTYLGRNETFTFETVLSTEWKLRFLRQAREKGYFVRGYFILTFSPWLNAARVEARAISGEHDVPREKIFRRYWRSLANIPEFLELCDVCHVYDNTIRPFRIYRKHKESKTAFESELWTKRSIERLVSGKRSRSSDQYI